jgi:hypothetical protein
MKAMKLSLSDEVGNRELRGEPIFLDLGIREAAA